MMKWAAVWCDVAHKSYAYGDDGMLCQSKIIWSTKSDMYTSVYVVDFVWFHFFLPANPPNSIILPFHISVTLIQFRYLYTVDVCGALYIHMDLRLNIYVRQTVGRQSNNKCCLPSSRFLRKFLLWRVFEKQCVFHIYVREWRWRQQQRQQCGVVKTAGDSK